MAVKPISQKEDNVKEQGFKVEGDLGDLQISLPSDAEDTEPDSEICPANVDSLSNFPSSLVQTSSAPKFSNIAVANSSNVQLGNNTHFHGPVIIKQIIHRKSGFENESYTNTEEEVIATERNKNTAESQVTSTKKYYIQPWHKLVITATCAIVVVVVFTVIFLSQGKSSKSQNTSSNDEPDTIGTTMVGLWYNYVAMITFTVLLVVITVHLMLNPLLIPHMNEGDKKYYGNNTPTNIIIDTSQFADNRITRVTPRDDLLIASNHLRIVSRTDWLAQPPEDAATPLRQPVPWVVITHTATESCHTQTECVLRVRLIQTFHIEGRKWDDIGYNFLVGGDGSAYYGRGWDDEGAHTLGYNKYSIGIAFVGTFNNESPPDKQIEACKKLITLGVQLGKLSKDYKLFAHRQLASTLSPGDKLFNIMKTWPNFVNDTQDVKSLLPPY